MPQEPDAHSEDEMRKQIVFGFLAVILISGLILIGEHAITAKGAFDDNVSQQDTGPAGTEGSNSAPDALIAFTISNPYCYQPNPAVDQCSINFRFIQAQDNQTSAPYMTWLAITISNKKRYNATAFFEGTITYSYDMVPGGLIVPCGPPNASGAGDAYGYVYGVTVQPLDSSRNPMATDIANLTCPAFTP
jgi:hypothetical protein